MKLHGFLHALMCDILALMMRILTLTFTLFSFLILQVQAANCALHCEVQEKLVSKKESKKMTQVPMKEGHECCHGNESNKENSESDKSKNDKTSLDCTGNLGSSCLHKLANNQDLKESYKGAAVSDKLIAAIVLPFSHKDLYSLTSSNYRPKIPLGVDRHHQRYKSLLRLHIIKDQFLI